MIPNSIPGKQLTQYFTSETGDIRYVFAPFIQRPTVERLLPDDGSDTIILTRWQRDDLRSGVSDPEVFQLCEARNYTLKVHPRLHAKVYSWDLETGLVGSANLTAAGMENGETANIEILTEKLELPVETQLKLRQAENDAQLVTHDAYETATEIAEEVTFQSEQNQEKSSIEIRSQPEYLTSQLPVTDDPEIIVSVLARDIDSSLADLSASERRCVLHDITSYSLLDLQDQPEHAVRSGIQNRFERHPFIKEIISQMDPDIYFGEMKELVQSKCEDVPTPSRRELTEDVQLIYTWFRQVSSDRFVIDIPGAHSERLRDTQWSAAND